MAVSYYSISVADTTIADIVVALTAKGLITENHFQDGSNLIFTSPISTKFIKLTNQTGKIIMTYGDGHTTGSLTGTVVTVNSFYTTPYGNSLHMMADTTWFAFIGDAGTSGGDSYITYYGATDSGKEITFGMYCSGNASYATANQCKNITDGTTLYPIVFSTWCNDAGLVLTQKLMWRDASSGQLLKNGSDPAGTLGVKNCSLMNGNIIKGASYVITKSPAYMTTFGYMYTSLLLDF